MAKAKKKAGAKRGKRATLRGAFGRHGAIEVTGEITDEVVAAAVGRPSKFTPEYVKQARKLCALGATDRELADFFGVAESTLHLWKLEHPEFSESIKAGKEPADDRVERSLFQRACGYVHDDVHISNYQGDVSVTPVVKHYPPDTAAGIFWLKNRRKETWRDKIDHSHEGIPATPPATIIIGGKSR